MPHTPDCFLFAGPSLFPSGTIIPIPEGVEILPPAQRGDITKLARGHAPGVCVLADGLFHHCAAVGHAELRAALQSGWTVWGVSSMGAIRAYEMRTLGMRGYGRVYERFAQAEDFQDDEVALLHAAEPPYRPFSEPLVHLRVALLDFERQGLLGPMQAAAIVTHLKSLWYGDRTLALFRTLMADCLPAHRAPDLDAQLADFDRWRIKSGDLASFLESGRWKERDSV